MDSKVIYNACHHHLQKIKWEKDNTETEWVYFGIGNDFKSHKLFTILTEFFKDAYIFYIQDRNNCKEVSTGKIAYEIEDVLKDKTIILSSKDFKKMIEISQIGVLRKGIFEENHF